MAEQPFKKRMIRMNDTTLRDGAQAPDVRLESEDKIKIARALDGIGIDELEVGTPAMGPSEQEDIRRIAALGLGCRLIAWCRARPEDLEAAAGCRVDGVHISLPVSDSHINALGKNRQWVLRQLYTLIPAAQERFPWVSLGAQDATRAEPSWLVAFARAAQDMGLHRLRIADTVGIARPAEIARLVGLIRTVAPNLPIEFHGHNDLGMATANALSAAEAGADALSITVNGLGERSGNTALEQIVMALHQHPELTCATRSHGLLALSQTVARAACRPIPPSQPVVGEMAFAHESGIHCHAMVKDPTTYEPFAPQCIGRADRRFVLGSHSGSAGIRHLLEQAGITASAHQVNRLGALLKRS